MSMSCEQLVTSARYLEPVLSAQQLSHLHHFALKGTQITFARIYRYFGTSKALGANNVNFGNRLEYVATRHQRGERDINLLIQEALRLWPL